MELFFSWNVKYSEDLQSQLEHFVEVYITLGLLTSLQNVHFMLYFIFWLTVKVQYIFLYTLSF